MAGFVHSRSGNPPDSKDQEARGASRDGNKGLRGDLRRQGTCSPGTSEEPGQVATAHNFLSVHVFHAVDSKLFSC